MAKRRRYDLGQVDLPLASAATAAPPPPPEHVSEVVAKPPPPPPELTLAMREVLKLPARLISDLPLATSLVCSQSSGLFAITTSRIVFEHFRKLRWPTFMGLELKALAIAAEHERASPAALAEWCKRKLDDASWALDYRVSIGGVPGKFEAQGWLLADVLKQYGSQLFAVECKDDIPEVRAHA